MTEKSFPERLFESGFTDLVSVIPPGAQLMPTSKIPQASVGKIPGRRHASGLWAGYNWRAHEPTIDDVRKWVVDGANVGLRAGHFPGVDIDCSEPGLAKMIEEFAIAKLGPAPVRVGRAPKRLLMYQTPEPFGRMRLVINTPSGASHLVEILGQGQQFLVHGIHPATGLPYEWLQDPTGVDLVTITRETADAFMRELAGLLEDLYGEGSVKRIGDGKKTETVASGDQKALRAPTIDALREAVSFIPNDDNTAPTRDEYIRMGYAIRAAAGEEHEQDGFDIFAEWAAKHEADGRVVGNPETWLGDWRRINPPYAVGWSFVAEMARGYGFNDAVYEFDAVEAEATPQKEEAAPAYSDQWLAEYIIARHRGVLRYVPQKGAWLVWDGARWVIDAELLAEDIIKRSLKDVAVRILREGVTPKEMRESEERAGRICSAGKVTAVAQLVRSDRAIAVSMESLDHDAWVLNTPAGIVDLRTGAINPPNPDALTTKITAVPPDAAGAAPEWKRFLAEATGGDRNLEGYLQRYAGYCLTGSVQEEQLLFVFGPGGNGKSVFTDAISGIMGDYAINATMSTFTASNSEKHSTDIAMMTGARLVTANETSGGKRWDDQLIKALTGGDRVTARFMRQDNFTFKPQFKLLFSGNHQPELRDVDKAMKRRIQMVPFTITPARPDAELKDRLRREEWPAILAWMIEGCLQWQRERLNPPAIVTVATDEYFENEDGIARWAKEVLEPAGSTEGVSSQELFQSWQEWANPRKEFVGSMKRLSSALIARGWPRWQDPNTRRMGFAGIRLIGHDLRSLT